MLPGQKQNSSRKGWIDLIKVIVVENVNCSLIYLAQNGSILDGKCHNTKEETSFEIGNPDLTHTLLL